MGLRRKLAFAVSAAILFGSGPVAAMPWLAAPAIITAVVTAVASAAFSFALSFVVSAIFKKPTPSLQHPQQLANPRNNSFVDSKANIKEPAGPWRVIYGETRVGNNMLFAHASSRKHMHLVLAVAHHEIEQFQQVWIGDEVHYTQEALAAGLVPPGAKVLDVDGFTTTGFTYGSAEGSSNSLIRFKFHKGAPGQGPDGNLYEEVNNNDLIGPADNFEGIAYVYVRLEHGPLGEQMPVFSDGIPAFTFVVRGKKILDPRDGVIRWSNNSALCAYDYMIDPLIGPKIDPANIYTEEVVAAANICEEQVVVGGGPGTQDRYTCNGAFTLDSEPQETLDKIIGSMRGRTPHDGDKWRMLAGAFYASVGTLTQDDFRLGPTINTVLSRRERFNSIKGTFVGYQNNWNESDFPPYSNPAWVADDEGEVWNDLQLPFTNDAAMAQRLARIELELSRRELTMTLHCKLSAWVYQAGDNIEVDHDVYTYLNDKIFEVQEVKLIVDPDSGTCGVDLEVIETSAGSYFWDGSEEIPSTPNGPGGQNPDLSTVDPVTNLTATEEVYTAASGGGIKSRLIVEWDAPVDEVIGGYQVEYKLQSSSTWIALPRIAPGTKEARIEDIAIGLYHVRVATVNVMGLLSTYVQIGVTVSGDTTPPEDVTGFTSVSGVSGFTTFSWNQPVHERARNGTIEIRYSPLTSGASYGTATAVFIGSATTQNAVLLTAIGTYLAKFKSANGIYSTNAASVVITTTQQPKVGVEIVNSLPVNDLYDGRIVYLTTDGKLYRYDLGTGWTAAVPATDLTGQLTDAQIADINAAKLTGQITETQIADNAISTPKLAAGSVSTAKLAAFAVTANEIAANAITSAKIVAGAILSNAIATGAVTADKILAGAVTAAKISVSQLSALTADLGSITAGTITGVLIRTNGGVHRTEMSNTTNDIRVYLNNLKVAQMGGTVAAGLLEIVGFFPFYYPAYLRNESNTGGGSENGGGALKAVSIGGWAAEFSNEATTAGTLGTMAIRAGNTGLGGGSGNIGESAATGGAAFRAVAGGFAPFTGVHDAMIDRSAVGDFAPGDIVVDGVVIGRKLSDVLTEVHLSSAPNQPALGAFVKVYEGGSATAPVAMLVDGTQEPVAGWAAWKETHMPASVNSVGEGCVNVCGEGGAIAAGDLIVTSSVPGKGMRQADDLVRSYTVARAREAVTFDGPGDVRQIACIYLCG